MIKRSVLNFLTSFLPFIVIGVIEFIKVRFFINILGEDVNALHQLFLNIFAYISLLEAGIGAAFVYRLYKPLEQQNHDLINQLYSGTIVIFRKIAYLIIAIAFIVSFLVPIFIKDNVFSNNFIQLAFLIYVVKNTVDYFFFVPRLILVADHKNYVINIYAQLFRFIETIVEIALILNGFNYIIILIPGIFTRILVNIVINKKARKIYPWLKVTEEKDKSVTKDIKNLFQHRIIGLVSNNIDIVILSSLVGSLAVTIYASYNYIIKFVDEIFNQIYNAVKDGYGKIINNDSKDRALDLLSKIDSILVFFAFVIVIFLFFSLNPFISIWIGERYVISIFGLCLFLIIMYFKIVNRTFLMVQDTLGLFKETKTIVTIEAFINLVLSLVLVSKFKIEGVLFATFLAMLLTRMWYYPYLMFKKVFGNGLGNYFKKQIRNILIIIPIFLFINQIANLYYFKFLEYNLLSWFLNSFIFGIIILIIVFAVFVMLDKNFRFFIIEFKNKYIGGSK